MSSASDQETKGSLRTTNGTSPSSKKTESSESANLNKVRDILFGDSLSGLQDSLGKLEKSIMAKVDALASEQSKRLENLENLLEKKISDFDKILKEEKGERIDRVEELSSSIVDVKTLIAAQVAELSTRQDSVQSELGKSIDDEVGRLSKTIKDLNDELDSKMGRLGDDKTDRATLANLFSELSKGLTGKNS